MIRGTHISLVPKEGLQGHLSWHGKWKLTSIWKVENQESALQGSGSGIIPSWPSHNLSHHQELKKPLSSWNTVIAINTTWDQEAAARIVDSGAMSHLQGHTSKMEASHSATLPQQFHLQILHASITVKRVHCSENTEWDSMMASRAVSKWYRWWYQSRNLVEGNSRLRFQ